MSTSYRAIPLSGKHGAGKVALVDEEDYEYLSQFRWHYIHPGHRACIGSDGYAARTIAYRAVRMHNVIMQPPAGYEVDHIRPGSGLDNRRSNLRIVTHDVNGHNRGIHRNNTTGYRGVGYHKVTGKWSATIGYDGRSHHLGLFPSPEEAAAVYEQARIALGYPLPGEGAPPPVIAAMPVSYAQPLRLGNQSGYRGVFWDKSRNKWTASYGLRRLGRFTTPEAASAAYEAARREAEGGAL